MIGLFLSFLGIGLVVGVVVTEWLHRGGGWPRGHWQQRFDDTNLRLANMPIGGVALLLLSSPEILHWTPTGAACLGASIGMAAAAIGWGLRYPLDES